MTLQSPTLFALGIVLAAGSVGGCSSSSVDAEKLRSALDRSTVSLADTISVAEADGQDRTAVQAGMVLSADPEFKVRTFQPTELTDVHINLDGAILSTVALQQTASGPCGGISLTEAIQIAEREAGGEAVAIVPDDDDACMSEVQVFTSDNVLWEVKLASDGSVVEQEESDESLEGLGDDDEAEGDDEEED